MPSSRPSADGMLIDYRRARVDAPIAIQRQARMARRAIVLPTHMTGASALSGEQKRRQSRPT